MAKVKKMSAQSFVSEATGLSRKQVKDVVESLAEMFTKELIANGSVNILGLVKVKFTEVTERPAGTKPNPFKPGETMAVKHRPAHKKVKVSALKPLKSLTEQKVDNAEVNQR